MIIPLKKKVRLKQTQVTKINLYIYVHMYLVRHAPRPRHYDSTCGVMAKSMKITSWWTCVANLIGWKLLFWLLIGCSCSPWSYLHALCHYATSWIVIILGLATGCTDFEWRLAAKMTKQRLSLTETNQPMEAKNEDSLTEAADLKEMDSYCETVQNRRGSDDEESQDKAGEQGVICLKTHCQIRPIFMFIFSILHIL